MIMSKNGFSFKAKSDGTHLYFYGDIVGSSSDKWSHDDVCPADVRDALTEAGDGDIWLHINSGGGDVFAASAICNMLRTKKGRKITLVEGLAASAASVIALSADEVEMPQNTMLMIHRASTFIYGNRGDLLSMAETLEKIDHQMVALYAEKGGARFSEEMFAELMEAETWMTAEEAAGYFENVRVKTALSAAAKVELPESAPESIRQLMNNTETEKLKAELELFDF